MFKLPTFRQAYLLQTPINMRWGEKKLMDLCKNTIGMDPKVGDAFLFFNRERDSLKLFFRDPTGPNDVQKRMPRGGFLLPAPIEDSSLSKFRQSSFKRFSYGDDVHSNNAVTVGAMLSSTRKSAPPIMLRLDKKFQPTFSEDGDELYANGVFLFNVSRLLAFIDRYPDRFPVEPIVVDELLHYGEGGLDPDSIVAANLSRPIVLAEISLDNYNLIDGNHRVARAKREGLRILPGWRIRCPQHVSFLTSSRAYEQYVEYWNGKVKELRRRA